MLYELAPAGNAIPIRLRTDTAFLQGALPSGEIAWVDSGAAALALAVQIAIAADSGARRKVVIPAYSCPEVVSAVYYAGGEPVLVDLEPETSWLDLQAVEAAVTNGASAVIAVDLFGIPERLAELRLICRRYGAVLIDDSAQRFPHAAGKSHDEGDLVVLSFGRGKPVSVLGGGVVIAGDERLRAMLGKSQRALAVSVKAAMQRRMKIGLYNLLRHPRLYWLPARLPGLGLGRTVFKPLKGISPMPLDQQALLPGAIWQYREHDASIEALIHEGLEALKSVRGLVDLPGRLLAGQIPRLSRYPFLVATEARDRLHCSLGRNGLGASLMYRTPLPEVSGLKNLLMDQGPFPNASEFARRLVTLPVHDQVQIRHIREMISIIAVALGQ
jgi:dTDP-4-amino-4,6-dideoxygalactose transaminase